MNDGSPDPSTAGHDEPPPLSPLRIRALHLLYDAVYVVIGGPLLLYKLATSRRFRAGFGQRMGRVPKRRSGRPAVWLHGVSVGEIKAGIAMMAELRERLPGWDIVLSSTTLQGWQVARDSSADQVIYYPLDFSWVTRRAIRRMRPSAVVLLELELWPNFLLSCNRRGVPVCVANGRISEKSFRGYRWVRRLLPEPHQRIRFYAMQNEEYAERIRGLGVRPAAVAVTGQMKYDSIPDETDDDPLEARASLGIAQDEWVLMGGSTHPGEEAVLLRCLAALVAAGARARLVLVPRHLERVDDVEQAVRDAGQPSVRRTAIHGGADAAVVIVDTIGELSRLYGIADLVFVGGSLVRHGGQSMIEPAAHGRPIVFGPHVWNFADTVEALLDAGGAVRVEDEAGLVALVPELHADADRARRLGEAARRVVNELRGATARNAALVVRMAEERRRARDAG